MLFKLEGSIVLDGVDVKDFYHNIAFAFIRMASGANEADTLGSSQFTVVPVLEKNG